MFTKIFRKITHKSRQNIVIKVTEVQLICSIFSVKFQKFEKNFKLPKKFRENIYFSIKILGTYYRNIKVKKSRLLHFEEIRRRF